MTVEWSLIDCRGKELVLYSGTCFNTPYVEKKYLLKTKVFLKDLGTLGARVLVLQPFHSKLYYVPKKKNEKSELYVFLLQSRL